MVAGSGTLILALLLLTVHPSAAALAVVIATPVLILGLLFTYGARRPLSRVAIGGCHNAATLILRNSDSAPPGQAATNFPSKLPTSGAATRK